jgi:hypothetical protein
MLPVPGPTGQQISELYSPPLQAKAHNVQDRLLIVNQV